MAEKYSDHVQILNVYTPEAHPGEKDFEKYAPHTSYEQKLEYACELVDTCNMQVPVLVDGMDKAVHDMFGELPNMVYVINKTGKVVYKSTWTVAGELEKVLQTLKTEDDAALEAA